MSSTTLTSKSQTTIPTQRGSRLLSATVTAAIDALLINISFALAWYTRYELEFGREIAEANYLPWSTYATMQLTLTVVLLAVFRVQGLYRQRRGVGWADELGIVFNGTTVGIAIMIIAVFYFRPFGLSRLIFVYAWLYIVAFLALSRLAESIVRGYLRRRGIGLLNILVVGAGRQARLIMQNVVAQPELGYRIVGFVDDDVRNDVGRFRYLGKSDEIPRLVGEFEVEEILIALPSASHPQVTELLVACKQLRVNFRLVPDFFELSLSQVDVNEMNGIPLIGMRESSLQGSSIVLKRVVDIVVSVAVLVLLAPLLGLVTLMIRLDSPGPIIIGQTRVGRGGRPFTFYKFRSMYVGAESDIDKLRHLNEVDGPIFKMKDDPRRTRVGRYLRRFSIDELPQIFNVLNGDMSLVGPRPPFPNEVERYDDWHKKRLEVSPGITGLWQVSGRSNLPFDEMVLLDIWYIENWSLGLDFKILARTGPAVLLGTGAY
jgi:exopolysaccharide biosynthesis polyprenyl glycosylphosphotransferase